MNNLLAYSLQVAALVAVAAFVPRLVQMKMPGARLAFWQTVLGTCLLLPLMRPWAVLQTDGMVTVTTQMNGIGLGGHGFHLPAGFWEMVLVAGMLGRLGWLAIGLLRLRCFRINSRPFEGEEVRISDEAGSPVTFGFLRPVIILPPQFPDLDISAREAILVHERLHIQRRDWLFTMAEELIRAIFWFHPAIWWTLGEIQLAREQVIDRAVTAITGAPDRYVDALLAFSGVTQQLDVAPAPLSAPASFEAPGIFIVEGGKDVQSKIVIHTGRGAGSDRSRVLVCNRGDSIDCGY